LQGDKILPGLRAVDQRPARQGPDSYNHDEWIVLDRPRRRRQGPHAPGCPQRSSSIAKNTYALVKAADLTFAWVSIGFMAKDWDWDGRYRTLKEIDLWSLHHALPAQPKASLLT
jgi:hypothetical protein